MTLRRRLAGVGALRFALRARALWWDRQMARRKPREAVRYLFRGKEVANFTYELANEDRIPPFLASLLGREESEIAGYLAELRADDELISDLRARLRRDRKRNPEPLLGRRRMNYCLVRAERPGTVVECGVHDGLGSAAILRALERNAEDGAPGRLLGLDLSEEAGWLVDRERHAERFRLIPGDIKQTLEPALDSDGVDFLLHDSVRDHEFETFEMESAVRHKRGRLVLYSEDALVAGAMAQVAERHGGRWEVFMEEPLDHYWQGNAVGICVID